MKQFEIRDNKIQLKRRGNKMANKRFEEIIERRELEIADNAKLVFSVSVDTNKEEPIPHVDIRTYVDNDNYTGPTKKGINFPIEWLMDFLEIADEIERECDRKGY